jgi:outer membrane protein
MRSWSVALLLAGGLASAEAEAQFYNHSIGISVGYLDYAVAGTPTGLRGGPDIGIDFSIFFESGIDMYARTLFGIYTEACGNVSVPIGGGIGARYLFSQEYFQPYLGLAINFADFTFAAPDFSSGVLFGFSVYGGAQYFISQGFSIGLTLEYQMNFAPENNFPIYHGLGAFLRVATHF